MALGPSGDATYPESLDPARRRLLGSYYTPAPLVEHLVEVALAPLMPPFERAARAGRIDAALSLSVLDPAAGDGVFLSGAARHVARRLAAASGLPEERLRAEVSARCLHGIDVDPVAAELARRRVREATGGAPHIVAADALAPGPWPVAGPFDLIVGNPPWGGWNRAVGAAIKQDHRRRFTLARGLLDPAMLFLERCLEWLRPGGRLALVLPDYFLTKNYPAARALVLARLDLEELARWGMAFPGVNVEACSLVGTLRAARGARRAIASAGAARRGARSALVRCLPRGPGGPTVLTPAAVFKREPGHVFNLELDGAGRRLLARLMKHGVPLGSLLDAHEGIHTGNVRGRLFVPPGGLPAAGVKPGALRPLVLGRAELRPFVLRPEGWRVAYDPAVVRRARGEYANLGRAPWYRPPKLLVRRTGDRIVAAVDRAGVMASNNLFVGRLRPCAGVTPELLAAYLNSPLATWCFRAMVPRAGAVFAELKLVHLARLPVPRALLGRTGRPAWTRVAALARRLEDPDLADGAPARAAAAREIAEAILGQARLGAQELRRVLVEAASPVKLRSL